MKSKLLFKMRMNERRAAAGSGLRRGDPKMRRPWQRCLRTRNNTKTSMSKAEHPPWAAPVTEAPLPQLCVLNSLTSTKVKFNPSNGNQGTLPPRAASLRCPLRDCAS
jgi:hypothetical protein